MTGFSQDLILLGERLVPCSIRLAFSFRLVRLRESPCFSLHYHRVFSKGTP
jgi:hypothetical protein